MAGFVLPIISGLAGLFGGGQQKKTTTDQQFNNTTNTANTTNASTAGTSQSNTNPILSALQNQLSTAAGGNALNANKQAADLTGYTQQGLENVNSGNSDTVLQSVLAGKGMSYSPAAATAETSNQLNRINQGNQFLAGVPLLQTQLKQQALGGLNSTFSTLPTATSTSGATTGTASGTSTGTTNQSGTSSGTETTNGNPVAGALGGLGAGLAAPSGTGNGKSNLGSILQYLGF